MTIEEAIKTMEVAIAEVEWNYPMDYAVAFEIALAALRAQQKTKKLPPPCYRSDGDGCAYQTYGYDNDEPIDRCKECPLCYSDKVQHYEAEKNEPLAAGFSVIDTKTGKYPDLEDIALHEEWAKGLCYCDIDGFCISENGSLVLMDDCGRCAYPPDGRFRIV